MKDKIKKYENIRFVGIILHIIVVFFSLILSINGTIFFWQHSTFVFMSLSVFLIFNQYIGSKILKVSIKEFLDELHELEKITVLN